MSFSVYDSTGPVVLPKVRMNFNRSLISMFCSSRLPCNRFPPQHDTQQFKSMKKTQTAFKKKTSDMTVWLKAARGYLGTYSTQFKEQNAKRPDIRLGSWGQWGFTVGRVTGMEGALGNHLWSKVRWVPEVVITKQPPWSFISIITLQPLDDNLWFCWWSLIIIHHMQTFFFLSFFF